MPGDITLVQQVRIASPCTASWEGMRGDDRVRFCDQCQLNVFNLSAMTQEEGERLILEKEGKLCARIYRRCDGTVLTRDCPVALAAIRRKARLILAKIAAVIVFTASGIAFARTDLEKSTRRYTLAEMEPFASINRWLNSSPPPGMWIAGDMCVPPPPPAVTTPVTPSTAGDSVQGLNGARAPGSIDDSHASSRAG